jgi:hypothetical protein
VCARWVPQSLPRKTKRKANSSKLLVGETLFHIVSACIKTLKNSGSVSNEFHLTRIHRNLAWAFQCKSTHKFEDSVNHHKIWLDYLTPLILHPQSNTLRFWIVWSPEECSLWYEGSWFCDLCSENLSMWVEWGIVLLSQGSRSRWRLEKESIESNQHSS